MKYFLIGLCMCASLAYGMDQPASESENRKKLLSSITNFFNKKKHKPESGSTKSSETEKNIPSMVSFDVGEPCQLRRACAYFKGKNVDTEQSFHSPRLQKGDVLTFVGSCEAIFGKKIKTLNDALYKNPISDKSKYFKSFSIYVQDIKITSSDCLPTNYLNSPFFCIKDASGEYCVNPLWLKKVETKS